VIPQYQLRLSLYVTPGLPLPDQTTVCLWFYPAWRARRPQNHALKVESLHG